MIALAPARRICLRPWNFQSSPWPCTSYDSLRRARARSCRHYAVQPSVQDDGGIQRVRNIGIIAHVDAGKTTTTEQMLHNCGDRKYAGKVDHGDTVTDFLPMERKRGITIQSAAITFKWPRTERLKENEEQVTINLIDTPGHVDFRFEVERCIPVLDGAVCIIDGVEGVEDHTERVWASAHEFRVPRIIFVNKLDRVGASFKKSVLDIGMKLGGMPLVCHIPWWGQDDVKGVVDVITGEIVSWRTIKDGETNSRKIEGPIKDEIKKARETLVELLCEKDEELLELLSTHGEDLPAEAIKKSIRRVINDGTGLLIPVFAGSSLKNIGVSPLLDAVRDYLPSPQDRPELQVRVDQGTAALSTAITTKNKKVKVESLASVFKVVNDPRWGMLVFVRVYHGALKKNMSMWNTNLQQFERPLNMMQISADKTYEISHLSAGQIGAMTGLKSARTGDTLITFAGNVKTAPPAPLANVQVRPPEIPAAVAFIVLEGYNPSGTKKIQASLESLSREDPSLRWSKDETTEQFTIAGMGTLHLEVAKDRLENHYKAEAYWGSIAVDYKECIISPTGPHHALFDKTVAGKVGKAACSVTIEPLDEHHSDALEGFYVERDGNIIKVNIESDEEKFDEVRTQLVNGALAALARGPRRNSPMHGCLVEVTMDLATDYFGPTPGAQVTGAAVKAVRAALKEAHAQSIISILEPVMRASITCPESTAAAVQHDLHSARGGVVLNVRDLEEHNYANAASTAADPSGENSSIIDMLTAENIYAPPDPYEFQTSLRGGDNRKGRTRMLEILAQVPLASMLDYDAVLRQKTTGKHTLSMTLANFARVTGPRLEALKL